MRLTPSGSTLHAGKAKSPTLVAITTHDAFHHMAEGYCSPVHDYLDGKLRLQGNVDLGRQIIQHLAGSGTQDTGCISPRLQNESYNPEGPFGGSLTLSGCGFTRGGTVVIVYNWGGGQYEQIATADAEGLFAVTRTVSPAKDIPGHPGVGVIVTATDLSTGQSTTQNYSTPC